MTDSIDLDDIDVDDPEADSENDSNYGDWLWRGEGDPDDEPEPSWVGSPDPSSSEITESEETAGGETTLDNGADVPAATVDDDPADAVSGEGGESGSGDGSLNTGDGTETVSDILTHTAPDDQSDEDDKSGDGDDSTGETEPADRQPIPGVPRTTEGPVGVPESQGGAGGGSSNQANAEREQSAGSQRTTNHGEATDPDDMTLALTYEAINRLEDPQFVVASARSWSDWLGIVGKVSTPAIRKFQRDEGIDLDFFGGSETGPGERLADITPDSMFYAERMVLVGAPGDERIAEAADWEFIPLETAAEKADWEIEHEN
ncbi:hypothetical protein [Halostagnicola sp. A-GB9-2]|uniref:DUF7124 domain-containing protein n=1 Tax=Halostagnicola sp. A-GB9-2 TaxID=3048066 RepID=UPI0024BFA5D3|nr:hypothetical protein [Halostagnicola sp. A-GB9-2]MDJ1430776.1 hypothetical protein [Halostagnicola sp. A-GB9-2]